MVNNGDKIVLSTIIYRINEIPTVDLDGELGMMSVEKGKYFCLDSIGAYIWSLICEPTDINMIVTKLLKEYDIDVETCQLHVLEFINQLHSNGLIKIQK